MEPSKRLAPFMKESIFEEMRMLIARGNMQNLCSGYTEWDTPQFLKDLLHECIQAKENFYGRTGGQQILVKAVAKEYSPRYNREIEAEREVVITHGATGALTNVCCAFLDEGDEVIIFEPFFESYIVQPALFGGKLRTFPLTPPAEGSDEWTIDFENFEKLFNEKSRILLVNTPHNPTGKVMKENEIAKIMEIVKKWPRLIILTDEVYEHMCYSGNEHIRIGAYKEMWDRTITMFTASKVFSCSGWRIGWAIGPAKLVEPLMAAQTWLCLGIHRPTQNAMAKALEYVKTTPYEDGKLYYDWMRDILEKKRDRLVKALRNCWLKMRVFKPEGGFFIMVDITESIPMIPSEYYYKEGNENKEGKEHDYSADYAFVRWIADKYRIVCIPCFPFYDQSHTTNPKEYRGSHLVRFALCKNDETLDLVENILGKE